MHLLLSGQAEEWRRRAERFQAACEDIARLHCSVVNSVNLAFLYDLYPYVWDLRNTTLVAKAFISWLGKGNLGKHVVWETRGHGLQQEPCRLRGRASFFPAFHVASL